jgi:large repetitive protein
MLAARRVFALTVSLAALVLALAATPGSAASFDDSRPCPASGPLLVCPTMYVGQAVNLQLIARAGCDVYRWEYVNSALPQGLSLSSSGLVTGTPTRAETTQTWMIVHDLTAAEGGPSWCGGDNHSERQFVFTVVGGSGSQPSPTPPPTPQPIQITTSSLQPTIAGSPYSVQLQASGGSSLTWSISAGSLPAGLMLSGAGAISGTPLAAGSYSFTVTVSDGAGRTTSKVFELKVIGRLSVTLPAAQQWEVGRPLEIPIAGVGGVPAYHWSISGTLPLHTAFIDYEGDGSTSRLHGVPGEAGAFPITITLTDSGGVSTQVQLVLTVEPKLQLRTFDPGRATVGKRYRLTLASRFGVGETTWAIAKGQLPASVTLDQKAGVISGTPRKRGSYRFVVTVTDSLGARSSMTYGLTVRRAP